MFLSNRLYNPTGERVEFKWHRGIDISVEADGYTDLTPEQMDDFRPDKPGAEGPKNTLIFHGLFLKDDNLDYDTQALKALEESFKAQKGLYKERVDALRKARSAAGITEEKESFDENLQFMGLTGIKKRIDVLESRVKYYRKVVDGKKVERSRTDQFDPAKTLYLKEGKPKEFPSKAAKALFKQENADLVHSDPEEVEASE